MRIMIMFDLPVVTKAQRRIATQFRNFLLNDGYFMMQYSVYGRVCNGYDCVEMHKQRLYSHIPPDGSVRLILVTEKQFQRSEILVGKRTVYDDFPEYENLSFF